MKQVTITISPVGVVKMDAQGYTGGTCKERTAGILAVLADPKTPSQVTDKPELHMAAAAPVHAGVRH